MDCVFCTRADQPPELFETEDLFVQPDKFPVRPGHLLLITKAHLPCYGAASPDLHRQLVAATARLRDFLTKAYAAPVLAWENGITGQTVHHAHLHLVPLPRPAEALPGAGLESWERAYEVRAIDGWPEVRAAYARDRSYFYAGLPNGERLFAAGDQERERRGVEWIAQATGVPRRGSSWVKVATAADVSELVRRWLVWSQANPAA